MSLCSRREEHLRLKRLFEFDRDWNRESIAAWRDAKQSRWATADEWQVREEMERRLIVRGWLPARVERQAG